MGGHTWSNVAPARIGWRKARASSSHGGAQCVELLLTSDEAMIRDSKNQGGPRLSVPAAGWRGFLASAKDY